MMTLLNSVSRTSFGMARLNNIFLKRLMRIVIYSEWKRILIQRQVITVITISWTRPLPRAFERNFVSSTYPSPHHMYFIIDCSPPPSPKSSYPGPPLKERKPSGSRNDAPAGPPNPHPPFVKPASTIVIITSAVSLMALTEHLLFNNIAQVLYLYH